MVFFFPSQDITYAKDDTNKTTVGDFSVLRDIDKSTFNEYRYYMVKSYFKLKESFDTKSEIDAKIASEIFKYAQTGYRYLPDNLQNQNYLNDLSIAVKVGIQTPNSKANYNSIVEKLFIYINKASVTSVQGSISATPETGNAPLTVTFRWNVTEPTGSMIPASNYVWRFDKGGRKQILGSGVSFMYTFREEGVYTVFLDVRSTHKNSQGYTDVLPYSGRNTINVKEKVASLIINVNSVSLKESDEMKFTPEEALYGLIVDATSSTPTGGARFEKTQWDFWNGIVKKYDWGPKVERVIYANEGRYPVSLKLTTNEGNTVERKFTMFINKPIATIVASSEAGYIGDKFNFSARSTINIKNLAFEWNVIDVDSDKVISQQKGNVLTYTFMEKGSYNVQLKVKDSAGNNDVDTKIIIINSRAPVSDFEATIPEKFKPSRVLLDGTKSYDQDIVDMWKLTYVWNIDGENVEIDNLDDNGAIGYYTFDSIWEHSIVLEVTDPDDMTAKKVQKVKITSLLDVDLFAFPRVIQRGKYIKFVSSSPRAKFYERDFGDGTSKSGSDSKMQHTYMKSGIYSVKLKVKDIDGNENEISKNVYVSESDSPYAVISLDYGNNVTPKFDESACGDGAYIIDRVNAVYFRGGESINIDGKTSNLSYTWKIGNGGYVSEKETSKKFDEIGCYPVKLSVKSSDNGSIASQDTWVKVENQLPELSAINLAVQNIDSDPVVVNAQAIGAKDPDGVIQSYLWYYYTDADTNPQDFRITATPSTTFVIPKIGGNYYFVVTMKDNNEARFSSADMKESKFSITITGDNVNTPLVDVKVNKTSINVWESLDFSVEVKNVLWQDITKGTHYSWDFDGDGFYDEESDANTIQHKFENSGTFYSKVRAKYKGMTNVRNVEISVNNSLEPNFTYTAIGSEYLFFNTSQGKYDSVSWDMGDGNKVTDQNAFSYIYDDNKTTHNVLLRVGEGTKTQTKSQEVVPDMKKRIELIKAKGIVAVTSPEVKDGKIIVSNNWESVYVYLGASKGDFKYYWIDFDVSSDSDLNGGKDDDIDNKTDTSYEKWSIVKVALNDSKTQTIRLILLDSDGKAIESKDVTIDKTYITQDEQIDLNKLKFDTINDEEKAKVEKLKSYVQWLPQENRLKGMQYVQKLQEEWSFPTEKTKIILEFENYIDSLKLSNWEEIEKLLESFLVDNQAQSSVRDMSYNVIKNLIPKELVEYDSIMKDLDTIRANPTKIDDNKVLGWEILEAIKDTSLISNDDKIIIKTQLQVFIYGGLENVPESETKVVEKENNTGWSPFDKVTGLLSGMVSIIAIVLGIIFVIIILFFIWYKVSNKNQNVGLQDFIIEKTSWDGDVLWGLDNKPKNTPPINTITRPKDVSSPPSTPTSKADSMPDWLKGAVTPDSKSVAPSLTPAPQVPVSPKTTPETVPDWLKGSIEPDVKTKTPISPTLPVSNPKTDTDVPDWLKGSLNSDAKPTNPAPKTNTQDSAPKEQVPDWLKGALDESALAWQTPTTPSSKLVPQTPPPSQNAKAPIEQKASVKVPEGKVPPTPAPKAVPEKDDFAFDEESAVPDWLKGSLNTNATPEPKAEKKKSDEIPDWLKGAQTSEIPEVTPTSNTPVSPIESKDDIPDWLKASTLSPDPMIEKKPIAKKAPKEEKTHEKEEKTAKKPKAEKDADVPDWLQNTPTSANKDFWTLDEAQAKIPKKKSDQA